MLGVIRKSRKLLSSKRAAVAIAQTTMTRVAVAITNLATGVLAARNLGASGRGDLSAIVVWPLLIANLLTLGLPAAIQYWTRREPQRRGEFYSVSIIAGIIVSPIGVAVGIAFLPSWLHKYPIAIIHAAELLMLSSPAFLFGSLLTGMLESLGEFHKANSARYGAVAITLVLLSVLALCHRMTPFLAAISYNIGPAIAAVWMAWSLRRHFVLSRFNPSPALKLLSSYGMRSYAIEILNTAATQVDQVLVISFLTRSDVGLYVVALNASRIINILHMSVVTVVLPNASGLDQNAVVSMVGRAARVSSAIAILFGAVLALALPVLLQIFYGRPFSFAVVPAEVLIVEAIIGGLVLVLAQAFMALGRPGIVTILQAIGLFVAFPLMVLLIPHFGILGAAFALTMSTTLRLLFLLLSYRVFAKIPLPRLIVTSDDIRYLRRAMAQKQGV